MSHLSRSSLRVPPKAPDRPRYIEIDDEENVRSTLNLEPDPSTIRPSRALTRIVKRLPVSTPARRDSRRNSRKDSRRDSRHASTDQGPVAGPSRLPASSTGTSKHVFDRLAEGEGVTGEEWALTEVCGNCGLYFLRKALREHIHVCVK